MAENHQSAPKPPSLDRREAIVGATVLLLLLVGFYWKLALTSQYTWFDHPDMAYLEIPRLEFQARQIHHSHFPLWDPHLWGGQPLIGQTQPGPLFPLNLLFYLAPLKSGYIQFAALNWYWVLIHWLAAWFTYLLARDRGLSRINSTGAGVLFACGGFAGTVAWLDVVNGAIWIPLVMLFVLRAVESESGRWRNTALGALFLGMAWLSGHHELPILLSMACVVVWLKDWRLWRYALVFFVLAGLLSAVQALPTYEFGKLSRRWLGLPDAVTWKDKIPYLTHTLYSLPAKGILAAIFPGYGKFADASPYMGMLPVALAVVGIATRWREWVVRRMTVLCGLATVYAMGVYTPLNGVMYALVPVVDKARIPMRAIAIVGFGIVVLSAYGMETVLSGESAVWSRRLKVFLGIAGAAIVSASLFVKDVDDRLVLAGVLALIACALLAGYENRAIAPRWLAWGFVALFLIDYTQSGPALYSHHQEKDGDKYLKTLTQYGDLVQYLRSQGSSPVRVHVDDQLNGANFGDWHGIDMLYGYVAGVSVNVSEHELHTKRTQDLFSVTHFVGNKPDKPQQVEAFAGSQGLKVYRNPDAFPRVRAVHETALAPSWGYMRVAIQDPNVDLRKTALFLSDSLPQLERCEGEDRVQLTRYSTDDITIAAELPCRGLVVLAETMFPGWTATVDGKPAEIREVYGALRSVVVERGKHEVRMKFRPKSVYYGAALSVMGLLGVIALCRRGRGA